MPDLVIFDCDGVLVDSELIFARVLAECLNGLEFPATLDEAIALGFGRNRVTLAAAVETRYGRALPEVFFETFAARSAAAFERDLQPMPGIGSSSPDCRCRAASPRTAVSTASASASR